MNERDLSDDELFDKLKHLASMWFKNSDILILEELFRRYNQAKRKANEPSNKTSD